MHNLDRNLLLELRIGALSKVNLAHPARAQGTEYPVWPYSISHHFCSMHPNKAGLQTAPRACGRAVLACMKAGPYAKFRSWTHVKRK